MPPKPAKQVGGATQTPWLVLTKKHIGDNGSWPFIVKLHHFQTKELFLHLTRRKGPLSYNGSRFHVFLDYRPDVKKQHAAFSEFKKKLQATKTQFGLYYLTTLQFTRNGK